MAQAVVTAPTSHARSVDSMREPPAFGDLRLPGGFWERVTPCPITGCWIWFGSAPNNRGYTYLSGGPPELRGFVHRVAYQMLVGDVGSGLELDHRCRNRACCNPLHLDPVTHRENLLRGKTIAARNVAVTHCPAGHEYTPENTIRKADGHRECRVCNRGRVARWRERFPERAKESNRAYKRNRNKRTKET